MEITVGFAGREQQIIDLFSDTFTASEGRDEGALIGSLVDDLLTDTSQSDVRVFCAEDESGLIGAVAFTPLAYREDPHNVVLLSPMAVSTERQRRGVGQTLITEALAILRSEGVEIAITYGDPDFYKRVGFKPITQAQARAPLPLSYPHGWLGQSLTDQEMPSLAGASTCVSAFNRPDVW